MPGAGNPYRPPGVGETIGPYQLQESLGRGGLGVVFRALDRRTGEVVAVKTAREQRESHFASIRREVAVLQRLRHSGVVRILDGGIAEGRPWYAMELLVGKTLGAELQAVTREVGPTGASEASQPSTLVPSVASSTTTPTVDSRVPRTSFGSGTSAPPAARLSKVAFEGDLAKTLTLFRRLCEPLAYIHGEGLVHRDLKPSNVFIRDNGLPVIMDFGLVWLIQQERSREALAVDAARAGTTAYMAPEQARGDRLDPRADLFALGCMMYESLTGVRPEGTSVFHPVGGRMARELAPPSHVIPGIPPELDELVLRLLAPDPRRRIGHAADVASILQSLGAEGWPARDDPSPTDYLLRPSLSGRSTIVANLSRNLDRLRAGHGGVVAISGESGIGKTSLLAEVGRLASLDGVVVVSGECAPLLAGKRGNEQAGGPLQPFRRLLEAIADRCASGGEDLTRRLLGDAGLVLAACDPTLARLPGLADLPAPPELPGEAARRRVLEALGSAMGAFAADRPLLLLVDDLQWADDLSIGFLQTAAPEFWRDNAILIVAALRSEELTTETQALLDMPHVERLAVSRLESGAIRVMVEDMLGDVRPPASLTEFLEAQSSGNPFFVAEYLRAALEARVLFRDGRGRWNTTDTAQGIRALSLPGSLRELIMRRVEGLAEGARRLLELGAVLGREVDVDALWAVAADPEQSAGTEAAFFDALASLQKREILEESGPGRLRFVHDKLREVTYEGIARPDRTDLHRRIARELERHFDPVASPAEAPAVLAHHFEQGGDLARAVEYLDLAGERALAGYANKEGARLLEQARKLEAASGIRRDVLTRARRARLLGESHSGLGGNATALECLVEAAALLGFPFPTSTAAVVARVSAELGRELARRSLGAEPTLASDADHPRVLEAARVYKNLPSVVYWVNGNTSQILCAALISLSVAERLGPSPELALAYVGMHITAGFVPIHTLAKFYGERARRLVQAGTDPVVETWAFVNTAAYNIGTCSWSEALLEVERIRQIAKQIGFHRRWEEATAEKGTALFLMGDVEQARPVFQELRASAERGDVQSQDWALVGLAQIRGLLGQHEAALELAVAAERLLEKGLGRPEQIYTLGELAVALAWAGEHPRAIAAAHRCADWIAKGSPVAFYNIHSYSSVVEALLVVALGTPQPAQPTQPAPTERNAAEARDNRADLIEAARRALGDVRAIARVFPAGKPRARFWAAAVDLAAGKRRRAAERFRAAADIAREHRMALDEALASRMLGHLLDGAEADEYRARAAELLRLMGVPDAGRHIVELLAREIPKHGTDPVLGEPRRFRTD